MKNRIVQWYSNLGLIRKLILFTLWLTYCFGIFLFSSCTFETAAVVIPVLLYTSIFTMLITIAWAVTPRTLVILFLGIGLSLPVRSIASSGGGATTNTTNAVDPKMGLPTACALIVAAGALAYYGMKGLCKAAGLTNTPPPAPPPVVTNSPSTNGPTKKMISSLAEGGSTFYCVTTEVDDQGVPFWGVITSKYQTTTNMVNWTDVCVVFVWMNESKTVVNIYSPDYMLIHSRVLANTKTGTSPQGVMLDVEEDTFLEDLLVPGPGDAQRFFRRASL
jgi:hypothetical protein